MTAKRLVVVVYQGAEARPAAVSFCEKLVQRFWTRFDFTMRWWSSEQLDDGGTYREAAQAAAEADLLIVCPASIHALPGHVAAWLEASVGLRNEREGTLACVAPEHLTEHRPVECHLRQVAHRAGLDFLTQVPEQLHDPFTDSVEAYSARARERTLLLDRILTQPRPRTL